MELEIKDVQGQVLQKSPFYDPEEYQSSRNFTVGTLQTLTRRSNKENQSQLIQNDLQFVQCIKQVSWYHYGVKRDKNAENKEESLELLQEKARMYAKRRTVNNPDIICSNLLKVTYLTYDNVFLFFFIKVLFFNNIVMILSFSVPALVKYGDNDFYSVKKLFQCSASLCSFVDRFSAYNVKDPESTFPLIQWLGFASLIILQIVFFIGWKINKEVREAIKYEQVVNENVALLKNLPAKKCCERDIIEFIQKKFFVENYQELKQNNKGESLHSDTKLKINKNVFNIKAVQILYDFRSIKKMINQVKQLAKNCLQLLEQKIQNNNKSFVVTDEFLYQDYKASIRNKCVLISKWRTRFLHEEQFRRPLSLDSAFIHFQNPKDKQNFIDYSSKIYPTTWIISWGTLEEPVQNKPALHSSEEQNLGFLNNYTLKVGLAPEPENIVWQKVELTFDEWKNENLSFRAMTFVIPLLHFGIMLGLQLIKTYYVKQNTHVILGYVISVGSVLANALYWPIMDLTLDKQNHRLVTSKQVQKNYIGFASQSLSIIVAPIITNYVLQGNFYGEKGVIGSAFQYQLTSLITIPFLMLINPGELIQKILSKIDCIRNRRFRRVYEQEEGMRQKASYEFFSIPQFEISSTYAFMMTNFLHVTCFCSALPILIIIYAAQLIVLYWVSKVRLVKFCRYPKLIRRWLLGIVFASLVVSPLFFIAGFLINLRAFKDARGSIEHDPLALYIYIGIWVLLSALLIFLDKKLQKTQLFSWFIPEGIKAKVENIESSRKKNYPSRSSSYFVENNAIPVLGFEKWIMGSVRNLGGEKRLQNLCENEVKKVYTLNNMYLESNQV